MAAYGHHPGQNAAEHTDPKEQGKLRLDARGHLRGKGVDGLRGALRFRATRDNRGNGTICPALALAVDKIKTFKMNTFTLPFFAAPNTSTATSCAKSPPSFAAPNTPTATSCAKSPPSFAALNTSSATSCAKAFTCVFHVSPKGTRVFGVGSELTDGEAR